MTQAALALARSELVLGGQKSGKSRRAEALAGRWLAASAAHAGVVPRPRSSAASHPVDTPTGW